MAYLRNTTRLERGELLSLERLDELLDVSVEAWDRTVARLVREFRTKSIRLAIPDWHAGPLRDDRAVSWTRLYRAQVDSVPRVDRAEEFRSARRYEFAKALVLDALTKWGFSKDGTEELLHIPFAQLPEPPKVPMRLRSKCRRDDCANYLTACIEQLEHIRNRYVETGLHIVLGLVYRYRNLGVDEVDLIQEGNASLFQAIDGFDWRRDVRFKTYAQYWVHQAVLKTLYNASRTVRLPIWVQKTYKKIQRVRDRERASDGRPPSHESVGEQLGMPADRVEEILGVRRRAISIDATFREDQETNLAQLIPDEEQLPIHETIVEGDLRTSLDSVLDDLPERERMILRRRFGLDGSEPETLADIAEDLGITAERVRQLQKAALNRLQAPRLKAQLAAFA